MAKAGDADTLDLVARCFEYPDAQTAAAAREAARRIAGDGDSLLSQALLSLATWMAAAPAGEAEERYTALFDLNPACALHAGWHLFGEGYQRGALLAGLQAELRRAGLEAGGDLPDFLPTLLRLLPRLTAEDAGELMDAVLLPSLGRMVEALRESPAPWARVLPALRVFLADAYGSQAAEAPPKPPMEAAAHA